MPAPAFRRSARPGGRRGGRPVLTGRALVLGALVVLLVVVLASPVTRWLGSRSDVSDAATQLRRDQSQLSVLNRQKAQWSDPGFIQQQARERLQYAMPGDTTYVVVDQGQKTQIQRSSGTGVSRSARGGAWNTRLWDSVRAADK
jgi:cell division protein FtsB